MALTNLKLFAGSSHPELASQIAKELKTCVSDMKISKFACGETYVRPDETVRGKDVYVVQTTTQNVNEDMMELFIILDALKRSFARSIHVIMPYFAYARQDRVALPREPISAKLMADLISSAGADHVITMTLHSDQEQGFFNFPVDNLISYKLLAKYFKKKNIKDLVVVSPDAGGAKDAKKFADELGADLAIIHKSRSPKKHNVSEVTHVVGDIEGKTCVLFDDMVDTGGSVVNGKEALIKNGAKKDIYLIATHPVFSNDAAAKLKKAKFKEVVVTNTTPVPKNKQFPGLKIISIAPLLAKIIKNVQEHKSVTQLF